jgi:hypothetical protein
MSGDISSFLLGDLDLFLDLEPDLDFFLDRYILGLSSLSPRNRGR